jgi:hypothetical protein
VGPTLVAQVRQATGHYQGALQMMALITLCSAALPLLLRPPVLRRKQIKSEIDPASVSRIA